MAGNEVGFPLFSVILAHTAAATPSLQDRLGFLLFPQPAIIAATVLEATGPCSLQSAVLLLSGLITLL